MGEYIKVAGPVETLRAVWPARPFALAAGSRTSGPRVTQSAGGATVANEKPSAVAKHRGAAKRPGRPPSPEPTW